MFLAPIRSVEPFADPSESEGERPLVAVPTEACCPATVAGLSSSNHGILSKMSFLPHAIGCEGGGSSSTAPLFGGGYDVGIHAYDLTQGKLVKPLEALVGGPCEGVLHSSLIAYGNEYFFEGGISVALKGKSRFGPKYTYTFVGKTSRTQVEFESWVRREEQLKFLLAHYNPVKHNCHHFTLAACDFLCPEIAVTATSCSTTPAVSRRPTFLLDNVNTLCETDLGSLIHPLFQRITGGIQFTLAQLHLKHDEVRQFKTALVEKAASMAGVAAVPPTVIGVFLADVSVEAARAAIMELPRLIPPHATYQPTTADKLELHYLARAVELADRSQNEFHVSCFVTLCEVALEQSPLHAWAPLLQTIRLASSHRSTLTHVVHCPKILTACCRVTTEAQSAPRGVLLETMRLLCSFALVSQGAMFLAESRTLRSVIRLAGFCIVQKEEDAAELAEVACALINTLAVALSIVTRTSIDTELAKLSSAQAKRSHVVFQLLSVALYGLTSNSNVARLSVNAMHFLLMAVLHLATSGPHCQLMFEAHPIKIDYDSILARTTASEECRAILCILSAVEDLVEV